MMKKTAAAVAALMLAACSGDSPSNALFEKTINNYAKKEGVCLPLLLNVQDPWGVESFTPVALGSTTVKIAEKDSKGNRINKTALKQMELLEDEGFYDEAESETLTKTGGGEKIRLSVYKLTRKGTEQVRGGEAEPRFCIGLQKVAIRQTTKTSFVMSANISTRSGLLPNPHLLSNAKKTSTFI